MKVTYGNVPVATEDDKILIRYNDMQVGKYYTAKSSDGTVYKFRRDSAGQIEVKPTLPKLKFPRLKNRKLVLSSEHPESWKDLKPLSD